jgi:putative hemolysin
VFEFDNTSAVEVMTQRTNVTLLREKDGDEDWERIICETQHSHYPVSGETADDILGVLSARDYFRLKDRSRKTVMEAAVKPASFVPESVKTDVLFKKMKRTRNHFAVLLDEYGGMSGIVTINDLLEALVGDFDDGGPERPLIEKLDTRQWRIHGAAPLDKVQKALDITLPVQEYDTFGGFVFSLLGEVPGDGQKAELEDFGLHISIEEIRERRLETALVRVLETEPR